MLFKDIKNIHDINRELYYSNQCNARLNGLFLGYSMDDNETVRLLIHKQRKSAIPVLKALSKYYRHRSQKMLFEDLSALSMKYDGNIGFILKEEQGPGKWLFNNNETPSSWLDLDNYDVKYTTSFTDMQVYPHRRKAFKNASPIEIVDDTIAFSENKIYDRPFTQNEEFNEILNSIYYSDKLDEKTYLEALKFINKDIIDTYNGRKESLEKGHINAILMLEDKSAEVFQNIDYPRQFGFYKTTLCEEMLKFSYLTTFVKREPFNEEDMKQYLKDVQNAGHWLYAHRIITDTMVDATLQLTGINGGMIDLGTARPVDSKNSMLRKYHKRDMERLEYRNLFLKDYADNIYIYNARQLQKTTEDYWDGSMRTDALLLSKVFKDDDTFRHLVHKDSPLLEPILEAFIDYHKHKNIKKLYEDIDKATTDENGMLKKRTNCFFNISFTDKETYSGKPYFIKDSEGWNIYLKDSSCIASMGEHRPSNWVNIQLYDTPVSHNIIDHMVPQKTHKAYTNVKPIDVMKNILNNYRQNLIQRPKTHNRGLDTVLSNLYFSQETNPQTLTKALQLFNKDLYGAYTKRTPLNEEYFKALHLLQDKSNDIFKDIDYQKQRTFYQTDLCKELVKFSYLTTFTKNKNFDKTDFENHLKDIKNAGSWILAHHIISSKIQANSTNFTGINGNLIELSTLQDIKNPQELPILRHYHREDQKRIADNYIGLETQLFREGIYHAAAR